MGKRPGIITKLDKRAYILKALLTSEHRQSSSQFPSEFFGEARLKMAALKSDGQIEAFTLFDQEVLQIWQKFRKKHSVDRVEVVVAAGRPKLPGVVVELGNEGGVLGWLTITAGRLQVAGWHPSWLILKIVEALGSSTFLAEIDTAQLCGYWAKYAYNGEPVIRKPIKRVEFTNPLRKGQEVRFVESTDGTQLEALFGTFKPFRAAELKREVMDQLEARTRKLAHAPEALGYWRTIPFLVEETIESGVNGVPSLGVGLPVNSLAGICMTDSPFSGDVIGGTPHGSGSFYTHVMSEMLRLEDAKFKASWYLEHLRGPIPEESIKALMAVLTARGIVSRGEHQGDFHFAKNVRAAGFRCTEKPLNGYHLSASRSALSTFQLTRGNTFINKGSSLAINEGSLDEIRVEIEKFRERVLNISSECRKRECLFQLNLHLYPLTRRAVDYRLIVTDDHGHRAEDISQMILRPLILDMARMEVFRAEGPWIAGKLIIPCTAEQCVKALEDLKKEKALAYDAAAGRLVDVRGPSHGLPKVSEKESRRVEEFMLQAVELCATSDQMNRFHLSTMMLPVSHVAADHLAEECTLMLDRMNRIALQSRGKDQLFRLNLTLFPLTR